ncbi:MAG: right-handed parallel beta-helix repeat-containing protein, partial [Paludibacter sp.]
ELCNKPQFVKFNSLQLLSNSFGARKVNVYGGFAGSETSIAQRSKVSGGKAWEFSTPTILDGNNASPQGYNSSGIATTPNTYIDGVTITKCKINNVTQTVYGIGAQISQGCIMQNCIVSNNVYNNTAAANAFEGKGGGIYLTGGQVLDSYIYGNQLTKGNGGATYGGGIAFAYTSDAALNTVNGCTIENNSSTSFGGGIEVINGSGGTIENCIFKTNTTAGSGGGLGSTNNSGTSAFSLKNCQFIENSSSSVTAPTSTIGGAGGADLFLTGTTTIEGCSFIGNSGFNVGGLSVRLGTNIIKSCIFRDNKNIDGAATNYEASALYTMVSTTTVQNCVFANNTSVANANKNHTVKFSSGGNFYNCTLANNNEPGANGYTFTFNGSSGTIKNCVFWNNTNTANFSGVSGSGISNYNATTSIPSKNTNGSSGGGTTGNITSLTISPNNTFVSPTNFVGVPSTSDGGVQKAASAAADWSLLYSASPANPAMNTGIDLSATPTFITTDILGNARPTGLNAVDRGAYEYGYTAQTITFGAIAAKTYGDAAFDLGATGGGSGNSVTYTSSNTGVATISGSTVTIVGKGSTNITASQAGSSTYSPATSVTQQLT